MKRLVFVAAGLVLLMAFGAFAQDPGIRDTVIIDTINVDLLPGGGTRYVHVYFVTDDSIMFVNLPITWTSPDNLIIPGHTVWREVFTQWDDHFDTLLVAQRLLRHVAWADIGGSDNPPLLTNGQRLWGMDLRFVIFPGAVPQFVWVDTTRDPINGSIDFGGPNGNWSFRPVVKKGYLRYGGATGIGDTPTALPTEIALMQNYPNPFNPETNIEFRLPSATNVTLEVYNLLGQKVKTLVSDYREAGYHTVRWNGTNDSGDLVPSGVYFYRMTAGDFVKTNKMIMLR